MFLLTEREVHTRNFCSDIHDNLFTAAERFCSEWSAMKLSVTCNFTKEKCWMSKEFNKRFSLQTGSTCNVPGDFVTKVKQLNSQSDLICSVPGDFVMKVKQLNSQSDLICNVPGDFVTKVKQRNSQSDLICNVPGDFVTKVKQLNSQSDLIWMASFAGPSYLTVRSSVYIILIWDPCISNFHNLCQTGCNYIRRESQRYALHVNE